MQRYMDLNKDYYSILGVLPTVEPVVIKAAYKALIKVYHPDRNLDKASLSHANTVELNEAYEVLSDTSKRAKYDNLRQKILNSFIEDNDSQVNFAEASDELENNWQVALRYEPELGGIVEGLSKLSFKLVFLYKLTIIESKRFDDKKTIAERMENKFLSSYFGKNKQLVNFAKELLMTDHRDAAKELNKVVSVLGDSAKADNIIEQIKEDFKINSETVTSTEKSFWHVESKTIYGLCFLFILLIGIILDN